MQGNLSIFDWNGNQKEQMQEDAVKFGITITPRPADDCMGFLAYTVEGDDDKVRRFLCFYELAFDGEEPEDDPEADPLGDFHGRNV